MPTLKSIGILGGYKKMARDIWGKMQKAAHFKCSFLTIALKVFSASWEINGFSQK